MNGIQHKFMHLHFHRSVLKSFKSVIVYFTDVISIQEPIKREQY